MAKLEIRGYQETDKEEVVNLWQICGLIVPWNDPVKDIRRKFVFQRDLLLVGIHDTRLVGTVMAGYEGHRGWINYLATDPDYRNRGYGRRLMEVAEEQLRALGCPKINLQIRTTNTEVRVMLNSCLTWLQKSEVTDGCQTNSHIPHPSISPPKSPPWGDFKSPIVPTSSTRKRGPKDSKPLLCFGTSSPPSPHFGETLSPVKYPSSHQSPHFGVLRFL